MRMLGFAKRNIKEILRDPLTLFFGLGFPIVLLMLLSAIQANIPVPLFEIVHLAPGIAVFGLSFMTLFSALLLARDRTTSLLARLYTTPMRASDFIFGYTLPMIVIALLQGIICYFAAVPFGLAVTPHFFLAILSELPAALLHIAIGLFCGSLLNDKQVGGICGALLTNLSAWLSGIWFDLELVGGVFRDIAYALPFVHAVELSRAALLGNFADMLPHLVWVLGYTVLIFTAAVFVFLRQMKR